MYGVQFVRIWHLALPKSDNNNNNIYIYIGYIY